MLLCTLLELGGALSGEGGADDTALITAINPLNLGIETTGG
jgi:hypothetical protein